MTSFLAPPFPCPPLRSPPRRPRSSKSRTSPKCTLSRRELLHAISFTPLALLPTQSSARLGPAPAKTSSTLFSVIPTTKAAVNLLPEEIDTAVDEMCTANAIFLGEHHNSLVDHALQARIVDSLQKRCARGDRKLAIGLEMVQTQFQDVLDMFVAGEIGEEQMFIGTEWDTRWVWPFETYLPLLRVARKYKIPLVALSIDSDTLSRIRERGIEALSGAEVQRYVGDAQVFSDMMKERAFKQYISECITPSYAAHYRLGLLQETKNFETFYTSRVMRDEVMATNVARYIRRTGCLMVTVVGADHVKFEYGVTGRVERQLRDVYEQPSVKTIMLNPSPADAFDARDGSLKLEMTVGNDAIPIADYLWFSSISSAKPRRRVRERKLPPVERLTSR